MKRVICIAAAIAVLIAMLGTVAFAKNEFVPSISYKDSPTVVPVGPSDPDEAPEKVVVGEIMDQDKEEKVKDVYSEHIVVTPVSDAETTTEIPQESKDQLTHVYEELNEGTVVLPYEKIDPDLKPTDMVIRDLFDVTIVDDECKEILLQENMTIKVTFDLGLAQNADVYCMVFVNDEWVPAVSTTNNGDGTVTVVLDSTGPVAFSVKTADAPPAQTGDTVGSNLPIWIGVMAIAAVALVVVLVVGNRKKSN